MKELYIEFSLVFDELFALTSKTEEITKVQEAATFYLHLIEKSEKTNSANDELKQLLEEFIEIAKELLDKER
jgi:hypothetical protein